jgi:hypothetical protein
MGTICANATKKKLIAQSDKKQQISEFIVPPPLLQTQPPSQSHCSQNPEELSATFQNFPFKIPILKKDIRQVYKFKKTIGNLIFFLFPLIFHQTRF